MKSKKIAFIGGDGRTLECVEYLSEFNCECAVFGVDGITEKSAGTKCLTLSDCITGSSAIVLPVPLSRDGINVIGSEKIRLCDVLSQCETETPIFAGAVTPKAKAVAKEYGREIYDCFSDETLTAQNALATAEGALMLAMQNSKKTLFESNCLILGYGRIGKYTARLLKGFCANVTVLARRREVRTEAILDGFKAIAANGLLKVLGNCDCVFNTIPANVIKEEDLANISEETLYIELASAPYGIDKNILKNFSVKFIDGSSLPSRYCPKSAGKYIAEKLYAEFERSGIV